MSSEIAIKVENLSKCYQIYDQPRDRLKQFVLPRVQRAVGMQPKQYYREFWALKDVSFEVKKGDTVGIIGRNGCGKSTLLQMICGTLNPSYGSIQTNGRIAALLELGSGFNPEFTGRENVYLNGALLGLSKEEVDERFEAIAAFADIGDFIEQPVKTYSSGMFVRLAFAIQANVDPEILIVDEALAVGDAYFVHRCMLRFNELQELGTTILFVSHDANSVRNLCPRAIWVEGGAIRLDGEAPAVVDSYLASLFNQKEVSKTKMKAEIAPTPVLIPAMPEMETSIPNIDKRLGTQELVILGVGLYNSAGKKIATAMHGEIVKLRVSFNNSSCTHPDRISMGYIFKNARGEIIASTNSRIEGACIPTMQIGETTTVDIDIRLPLLCPGSYSFSPTVGYLTLEEQAVVCDRIENAILLQILIDKPVPAMMRFQTEFEVSRKKM